MDKLEELIGARGETNEDGSARNINPDREIYEEEQKKIDGWKGEVADQVSKLNNKKHIHTNNKI